MHPDGGLGGEDFFDWKAAEVVGVGDNELCEKFLAEEVADGGWLWGDGGCSAGLEDDLFD